MKQAVCQIVKGDKPWYREYHTKVALTDEVIEYSGAGVGPFGQLVMRLPGVAEIFVHRYHLTVFKGQAFDWAEVEPGILAVLEHLKEPPEEPK